MKTAGPTKKSGTKLVAYQGPEEGPFRCGRCIHFMPADQNEGADECWHPKVIEDPEMELDEDGHAMVDARGCCEYFRHGRTITKARAEKLMAAGSQDRAARVMSGEEE